MVGMRIADVQEDIDHELISKEEIADIINRAAAQASDCLLYTSDAADE